MKAKNNQQKLAERLKKDRPMTSVTLRMPEDVIDELKAMAPTLGFSGYQPLMRAYIGQGMRQDQQRLDQVRVDALLASLRKHGVSEELIDSAINEIDQDDAA